VTLIIFRFCSLASNQLTLLVTLIHTYCNTRWQEMAISEDSGACTNPLTASISEPLIPTFNCRHDHLLFLLLQYVSLPHSFMSVIPNSAAYTSPTYRWRAKLCHLETYLLYQCFHFSSCVLFLHNCTHSRHAKKR
jgi:hypothetical protein